MKNISEYTVPRRYSKCHNFVETLAYCAIGLGVFLVIVLILATATIMIWGR